MFVLQKWIQQERQEEDFIALDLQLENLRSLPRMLTAELMELVLCRSRNCFGQLSQKSSPHTLSMERETVFLPLPRLLEAHIHVCFLIWSKSVIMCSAQSHPDRFLQRNPVGMCLGPTTSLIPQYPTQCSESKPVQGPRRQCSPSPKLSFHIFPGI